MNRYENTGPLEAIAAEAFAALSRTHQISPFSGRPAGLSVEDAYRITPLVRQMYETEGAKTVGRKIGFTNRTIWAEYGVYAPIWGHVFDRSVLELAGVEALPLKSFSEPRIEPEIVFGLGHQPSADMDETALSSCIAWVALGFEIVQSIFPGWKFAASDTIAANGVHGALLIGPRHPFAPRAAEWRQTLARSRSIWVATAGWSTAGAAKMCWAARSRRCAISSTCSPPIPSIRRLPPAKSSARAR
jgi:2-keto-4-pentenoate hydratase